MKDGDRIRILDTKIEKKDLEILVMSDWKSQEQCIQLTKKA